MNFNRTDAARTLLSEIEGWCARTNTPETTIGRVLFLHPGFVGLLRLRLTLSEDKERAVREFLYALYPEGYHGELPKTHSNGTRPVLRSSRIRLERGPIQRPEAKLSEAEIAARRVNRDACPYCGTRADIGCRHRRLEWQAA